MEKASAQIAFSRGQQALLLAVAIVWFVLNWVWVAASGKYAYLFTDSLYFLNAALNIQEQIFNLPWTKIDFPCLYPPFPALVTAVLIQLCPSELFAVFLGQALPLLGTYAIIAALTRRMYGAKAAVFASLVFLSTMLIECVVRVFQADGWLCFWVTASYFTFYLAREKQFSWSSCAWWAATIYAGCLTKWSTMVQWQSVLLLYALIPLLLADAKTRTNLWIGWLRAGGEVLFWIFAGLAVVAVEALVGLPYLVAALLAAGGLWVCSVYTKGTPLRRFLVSIGWAMTAYSIFVLRAISYGMLDNFAANCNYSGSVLWHVKCDWSELVMELVLMLHSGVLLNVLFAVFVVSICLSFAYRRLYRNLEMLGVIVVPAMLINAFFFYSVVPRYYMGGLGLMAIAMGGALFVLPRCISWTALSWCLFAKLVFLAGWLTPTAWPQANHFYIESDEVRFLGISEYQNRAVVPQRMDIFCGLQSYWSSSWLFTSSPEYFPDLDALFSIWERETVKNGIGKMPIVVLSFGRPFVSVSALFTEWCRRQGMSLEPPVCPGNNITTLGLGDDDLVRFRQANKLLIVYPALSTLEEQQDRLERHLRVIFSNMWKLEEIVEVPAESSAFSQRNVAIFVRTDRRSARKQVRYCDDCTVLRRALLLNEGMDRLCGSRTSWFAIESP